MGMMWLWWLAGIAAVGFVVWIVARAREDGRSRPETPEEILDRRYANGEIDRDEYERKRADLRT